MPQFRIDLTEVTFCRDLASAKKVHPSIVEDLAELFGVLENNHTLGDWIPGLNAQVRKARVGVKKAGIGKSKGYRLIYFVEMEARVIRPLLLHYKPRISLVPNADIAKIIKAISERKAAALEPPSTP